MNARLSLAAIASRLQTQLTAFTGLTVGTAYQRSFWQLAPSSFPGVWVGGQTLTRIDDGSGYGGLLRQRVRIEFGVRVIVARAVSANVDPEANLNALIDGVSNALIGWRPSGADLPLTWTRTQDESPQETVMSAVLQFATETTYQRPDA
jgi:hypothetical protein